MDVVPVLADGEQPAPAVTQPDLGSALAQSDLGPTLATVASVCADPQGFTLDELFQRLGSRTWHLLLIVLPLPFITPIPLPGLSMPFGIAIAAIGVGLLLRRTPVLPVWVGRLRCPAGLFARVLVSTARQVSRLESCTRQRLGWLVEPTWTRMVVGPLIIVSGLLLAQPLPIPLSHALPAITIILTGVGLVQRDGLVLMIGHLAFAATLAFFAVIAWGLWMGVGLVA